MFCSCGDVTRPQMGEKDLTFFQDSVRLLEPKLTKNDTSWSISTVAFLTKPKFQETIPSISRDCVCDFQFKRTTFFDETIVFGYMKPIKHFNTHW